MQRCWNGIKAAEFISGEAASFHAQFHCNWLWSPGNGGSSQVASLPQVVNNAAPPYGHKRKSFAETNWKTSRLSTCNIQFNTTWCGWKRDEIQQFHNTRKPRTVLPLCQRPAQLDAEIAWSLKSISVSNRLENIYVTKWASVFCQKVASWQDLMQGKRLLWLRFFRLFYSIFGRHVPKLKRSESKTLLFWMAHSCKVPPMRHSLERCCFVSRRCS